MEKILEFCWVRLYRWLCVVQNLDWCVSQKFGKIFVKGSVRPFRCVIWKLPLQKKLKYVSLYLWVSEGPPFKLFNQLTDFHENWLCVCVCVWRYSTAEHPNAILRNFLKAVTTRLARNFAARVTTVIIIIINIKDWTLSSVPSPELQLLAPTLLRSSNCSPCLWSVVVWFQRDSVLWHYLQV